MSNYLDYQGLNYYHSRLKEKFIMTHPTALSVKTNPAKMDYKYKESFEPNGMEIEVTYSNGAKKEVKGYSYEPKTFESLNGAVTISYHEDGVEVTTSLNCNVTKAIGVLSASETEITIYDDSYSSALIYLNYNGDGVLSFELSDNNIVTPRFTSNDFNNTYLGFNKFSKSGNLIVTIKSSECTNYTTPDPIAISVKCVLNDYYTLTGEYINAGTYQHTCKGTKLYISVSGGGGGGGAGGYGSAHYIKPSISTSSEARWIIPGYTKWGFGGGGGGGGFGGQTNIFKDITVEKGTVLNILIGDGGAGGIPNMDASTPESKSKGGNGENGETSTVHIPSYNLTYKANGGSGGGGGENAVYAVDQNTEFSDSLMAAGGLSDVYGGSGGYFNPDYSSWSNGGSTADLKTNISFGVSSQYPGIPIANTKEGTGITGRGGGGGAGAGGSNSDQYTNNGIGGVHNNYINKVVAKGGDGGLHSDGENGMDTVGTVNGGSGGGGGGALNVTDVADMDNKTNGGKGGKGAPGKVLIYETGGYIAE